MKLSDFVLERKNLIITIFSFFILLGLLQFFIMPREEDPRLKERFGSLKIIYPGASIESMERLIVLPTEEALAEIPEIKTVDIRIRPEAMIAEIRLSDNNGTEIEINNAWKRIEDAIKKIENRYPSGILPWDLNRRVLDQEAILIGITGSEDLLVLKDNAADLRLKILSIPSVAKVNRLADPEEEIIVQADKESLDTLGITLRFLSEWISLANHSIPPGTLSIGGKKTILKSDAWFTDLDSIRDLPIPLPGGRVVPLSEIAGVYRAPRFPVQEKMRWKGKDAVGLGVVAKKNINLVQFGEEVEKAVAEYSKDNPSISVEIINSQSRYVGIRLKELGGSLLSGILIVALVLISMMGFRLGFLSSLIVPIIAVISLGIYGMSGGVLHQISIAAFVMALGLLIDNVIVVLESIQEKLDAGESAYDSAKKTIDSLAFPLFSATGTTLAAFIPMLGSAGNSADFTRAIPSINMLTLAISFFFAVLVTPILGFTFLKPNKKKNLNQLLEISERIGSSIPLFAKPILGVTFLLFSISMLGFGFLPKKFFPDADRDQLLVDFRMPEGTDVLKTEQLALEIDNWFRKDPRVKSTAVFIGRTAPLFYYNLTQSPSSPHIAQIIVNTKDIKTNLNLKSDIEARAQKELKEGNLIIQELKQGPPIKAPIELRFFSESLEDLEKSKEITLSIMRNLSALRETRADLSIGTPVLKWETDDASLGRYRSTRSEMALAILSQTRGIQTGVYRAGERPIPILIRTRKEKDLSFRSISESPVLNTRIDSVPLSKIAQASLQWETSMIYRRNRKTGFSILSETTPGVTAEKANQLLNTELQKASFPKSVRWEFGGEQSESSDANKSLIAVAPMGIMILIAFLLWEFKTWKKTMIILLTVPLSMIGVVPGLLLSGKPFGFLSLLGIFALVGIVVNNGILLLDYIFGAVAEGLELEKAIISSLAKRIRPILLTTMTTIAGLLPLVFTDATLWPPFAWTLISGLLVSTLLTLVVVPSAVYLLYKAKSEESRTPSSKSNFPKMFIDRIRKQSKLAFLPFFLILLPTIVEAKDMDWREVVKLAEESPRVRLAWEEWKRKHLETERLHRAVYYPKLGIQIEQINRDRVIAPNASIPVVAGLNPSFWSGGLEVQQTIFDPANWFAVTKALEFAEDSARYLSYRAKETSQAEALLGYLSLHKIQVKRSGLQDLQANLIIRLAELKRLYAIGQVTESELFRIEQAISQTKIAFFEIQEKERIASLALARSLGISENISIKEVPTERDLREDLTEDSATERYEIQALQKKIQALDEKRKSIEYEALPKLVAKGNYVFLNNNQFNTDQWAQVSIGLSVNPFDAGIRGNRIQETESEMISTKEELQDLRKALQLELEDAKANIQIKKKEIEIRTSNVSRAKSASQKELERMRNGRSNINSWIDAEILYAEEKDRLDMAKVELLENLVKFRNVMGKKY